MAMSGDSTLVESLDLVCGGEGGVGDLPTTSPKSGLGWHSPRISFSSDFIDKNRAIQQEAVEISGRDDEICCEDVGADFEFCMPTSTTVDDRSLGAAGSMLKPADELFHKGKLRPFSLPSRNQVREQVMPVMEEQQPQLPANPSVPNKFSLERSMSSSMSTPVSTRCSDDVPSSANPSVAKSRGWREGFGLLRRARSDGTRCWPASGAPENNSPPIPTKASALLHPPHATSQKQQFFTSSSFRMLFKQPSVEHAVERSAGIDDSSYPQAKRTATRKAPKNRPRADSVPVSSSAPPGLEPVVATGDPSPELLGTPGLSALQVASPIHPTTTAAELLVLEREETLSLQPQLATVHSRPRSRSSRSHSRPRSLVPEGYVNGFFKKDSMERELLDSTSGYGSGRRQNNPSRAVMRKLDNNRDGDRTSYQTTTSSSSSLSTPSARRIVLRNLERCSTASGKQIAAGPKPAQENHQNNLSGSLALPAMELQQQIDVGQKAAQENHNQVSRAFMTTTTRGAIRRSSDQGLTSNSSSSSYYSSNVRVAPVLNLPQVCIAPGIRSYSSSSSRGHLASLRSLFFFKKVKADCNPPPTTLPPSSLPIAN